MPEFCQRPFFQYLAVVETAKHIVGMIEQGYEVVITHGNGPQVGFILRRSEIAREFAAIHEVPPGSMLPKVQAVIQFLENGGKKAIITNPESLEEAIAEKAGTYIRGAMFEARSSNLSELV